MPLHIQKRNIKSRKIDKRKRKMLVSKHIITPSSIEQWYDRATALDRN